ncbi:MAG: AmmeMemoRadiSam system protein B [Dehalococcoidales bacterium]|nr:AmmeMemoRadiSam system protein B [Dehalococcoidales bacterium]
MKPKLRPLDTQWINHDDQPVLVLRDRLDLSGKAVAVPAALTPLLVLCDGTREPSGMRAAFELQTGIKLSQEMVDRFIAQFDEVLMLDSPRYAQAMADARAAYRAAPYRPPALADKSYPGDPDELRLAFERYLAQADGQASAAPSGTVRGVVCPHIDYTRGGPVYARTWQRAATAVREAEVIIVLGTDHMGAEGALTLTRQRYATPWGPLPLAEDVIEAMAAALGEEEAFAEELHHRSEHSLELGITWLHYFLGDRQPEVVPILCGGFHVYTEGLGDPAEVPAYERAFRAVAETTKGRRVLVVAAADLAHVGPAFGDAEPLGPAEKSALAANDKVRLAAACSADAAAFLAVLRREQDRQRVCGLPPIYFALRLLGDAKGEVVTYDQCPADDDGGSLVSIAGLILT